MTTEETSTDAPTDDQVTDTDTTDWKAEAEKYKALHRKQEERAKANATAAKELETLKAASATDTEKAIAQARVEARTEALRESGGRLVDAEVRAAAAGRNVDVKALLEGLDRTRFLDDDGEPDSDGIQKWVDRIAPASESSLPKVPAGVRDTTNTSSDGVREFAALRQRQLNKS